MSLFLHLSWAIFFIVLPRFADAGACDGYRKDAPDFYCIGGSGSTRPAGATSTFSEAFKLNPATLPTEEAAYGLEILPTFLNSGASPGFPTLALIKGFHRFGAGISTSAGNTFYSNDIVQRISGPAKVQTLDDPEPAKGYAINLNLGTSFLIFDPSWGPALRLGLSARYNRITNTVGGGPALFLGGDVFSVGIGLSHETTSNFFPAINFITTMASARIWRIELELDVLSASTPFPDLKNIEILTGTYSIGHFVFTAAVRELNYLLAGDVVQPHFAVQYRLGDHFSLGYLFNYIPGGNTLGLQVYI